MTLLFTHSIYTCGAKTRAGAPCQKASVTGKQRCRNHGGASTGPRTQGGKRRSLEALARGRQTVLKR